ncbi:MAG: hypothetical protein IT381_15955 [Deltaproteobacteria bacterium]|nr:hypothetical protein [Deltaproteobacteria bacterium]
MRSLSEPFPFVIPSEVPVVVGACANHWLDFDFAELPDAKPVKCRYRCDEAGGSERYVFENCQSSHSAGDAVSARFFLLQVQGGDHASGSTAAALTLLAPQSECVCQPLTCEEIACGVYSDGCGGIINCGGCVTPQNQCFGVDLSAAETFDPHASIEGRAELRDPIQVSIPADIVITEGNPAGNVTLQIALDGSIGEECLYAATGAAGVIALGRFSFASCLHGSSPGDPVTGNAFSLRVESREEDPDATPVTVALRLNAEPCACMPASCEQFSATCGVLTDGCGGLIECGSCESPLSCGGDVAAPLTCGCTPRTCAGAAIECGEIDDGCGGQLDCGECVDPQSCGGDGVAGRCGCTPRTCEDADASCGLAEDGCGGFLDCGGCDIGTTCGGGGAPNVCGCAPATCEGFGRECGLMTDGCGATTYCGNCAIGSVCEPVSGACVTQEVVVNASDPAAAGASLTIAPGSLSQWTVFNAPVVDPSIPINSFVTSTLGPVVTIGPLISFNPSAVFSDTTPCTTMKVPYSQGLAEEFSSQSLESLRIYRVTLTPTGSVLLVPVSANEFVDASSGSVTICTHSLSAYVVALRVFCTASVTSDPIDIAAGSMAPARTNADWVVSTADSATFDAAEFRPTLVRPVLTGQGTSEACVGALLLYGGPTCPAGSPGGLCRVCHYDNADRDPLACYYPFGETITACPSATAPLLLRGCYDIVPSSDPSTPPPELGQFAAYAATIVDGSGNFLAAAWVDPRVPVDRLDSTTTYNLSTWFTKSFDPVAAVLNLTSTLLVESHPHICIESAAAGVGSRCGQISDGCGGDLPCGGCNFGLTCDAGGFCVCPVINGQPVCPGQVQTCGTQTYDSGNPCVVCDAATQTLKPAPDATFCGDTDGCNGVELCFDGVCRGGVPPLVSDGDPCTKDSCPAGDARPRHDPDGAPGCATGRCCDASCTPEGLLYTVSGKSELSTLHKTRAAESVARVKQSCPTCAAILGGAP